MDNLALYLLIKVKFGVATRSMFELKLLNIKEMHLHNLAPVVLSLDHTFSILTIFKNVCYIDACLIQPLKAPQCFIKPLQRGKI